MEAKTLKGVFVLSTNELKQHKKTMTKQENIYFSYAFVYCFHVNLYENDVSGVE